MNLSTLKLKPSVLLTLGLACLVTNLKVLSVNIITNLAFKKILYMLDYNLHSIKTEKGL